MSAEPRPNNTAAAIRGVLLVLVAVVIGILLLQSSSDDDSADAQVETEPGDSVPTTTTAADTAATPAATSTSQATTATIAPPDPTTSTTAALVQGFTPRPASEVTVQVANSTQVGGAAGRLTDRLKALNYVTGAPTNMSGTPLDTTRVFYQSGSLLEAQQVAEVLGLDRDEDVAKIFTDTSSISSYETPDVLVALGLDLAQ